MKNYAYGLRRTCDKHIDPILTDVSTGRHRLLCLTFCFAYFHPVDQGNWYRGHCTENYCASPKAILTLHKMFVRDWCETILTSVILWNSNRNCAKQQEDARGTSRLTTHPACTYGNLILMITDQEDYRVLISVYSPFKILLSLDFSLAGTVTVFVSVNASIKATLLISSVRYNKTLYQIFKNPFARRQKLFHSFMPPWSCRMFLINVRVIRQSSSLRSALTFPSWRKKETYQPWGSYRIEWPREFVSISAYIVDSSYYSL